MKTKLFLCLIFAFLLFQTYATNQQKITTSVNKVTVFLQGAQVNRTSNLSLQPGLTQLIFTDLENGINSNSIQVNGEGNFTITEILHTSKHIQNLPSNNSSSTELMKNIDVIEQKIRETNYEIEEIKNNINVLTTEKNLLLNNPIIKGQTINDSLDLLIDAIDFIRPQLNEVNSLLLELIKRKDLLDILKSELKKELDIQQNLLSENQQKNQTNYKLDYRIIITVLSKKEISGKLNISYILNNAGWKPAYDIRAYNSFDPVKLSLKARIYQNTGQDWNNIKLTASTHNPFEGYNKPNLYPIYADFFVFRNDDYIINSLEGVSENDDFSPSLIKENTNREHNNEKSLKTENSSYNTTIQQQIINEEYIIDLPYNIPSDAQHHTVILKDYSLNADFTYYTMPKYSESSYVLARIGDWSDVNIMKATANLYFDKTYIGQSLLDPNNFSDTLNISFGKDKSVSIKKNQIKEKVKKDLFGGNVTKIYYYEYTIHNLKQDTIQLITEDQIPISKKEEIEIKLLSNNEDFFSYDEKNGLITWRNNMLPGEIKKLELSYSIKYPKDKKITIN